MPGRWQPCSHCSARPSRPPSEIRPGAARKPAPVAADPVQASRTAMKISSFTRREAMDERGGRLTVRLEEMRFQSPRPRSADDAAAGPICPVEHRRYGAPNGISRNVSMFCARESPPEARGGSARRLGKRATRHASARWKGRDGGLPEGRRNRGSLLYFPVATEKPGLAAVATARRKPGPCFPTVTMVSRPVRWHSGS